MEQQRLSYLAVLPATGTDSRQRGGKHAAAEALIQHTKIIKRSGVRRHQLTDARDPVSLAR